MPWNETSSVEQRRQFIQDYVHGSFTMTELSERYAVSRKTAYKWLERFEGEGLAGLQDRSRRPHTSPSETPPAIVDAIVKLRKRHPFWGAKKLLTVLQERDPRTVWPSRSTVCDILTREGLVTSRTRRRYPGYGGRPITPMTSPNELWAADFKGQFRTGNRVYCYPLTLTDGYSRYLLECRGLLSTAHEGAQPVFTRVFREFGLPAVLRTDNGVPFATTAIGRLSRLSVWWIRLGIYPELIQPAHPEQNGRHERMHRTLKQHTARPPAASLAAQQRRFDAFRTEYNQVRPHEALGLRTPATLYLPSERAFPARLPELEYPAHFELRKVSATGAIRWNWDRVPVSHVLAGEYVGLEEIGDGIWDVYFGPLRLGQMHEKDARIEDALGRRARRHLLPKSPD
jgi:transposase InsO family protein